MKNQARTKNGHSAAYNADVEYKDFKTEIDGKQVLYRFYASGKAHPILKVGPKIRFLVTEKIGKEIKLGDERSFFEIVEAAGFTRAL